MPSIHAVAAVRRVLLLGLLLISAAVAHEGYHPGFDQIPPGLNEVDTKEEPPTTYFAVSREVTEDGIGAFAAEALGPLMLEVRKQQLNVMGPITFIYRGREPGATSFTMDIAIPVIESAGEAPAGYTYLEEPMFRSVSGVFKGTLDRVNGAWGDLLRGADDKALESAGQEREIYLHWVRPDSPNNVIDLQHGIR